MKKYFFTIGTLIFFLATTRAQEVVSETHITEVKSDTPADMGFLLGFRFMPTISSVKVLNSDGNTVNTSAIVSYGYGGVLGLNFNQHIGIQLEVLYNTLSQKYADHTFDRRIDVNYVNVPLLLSLNTNRKRALNLNFVLGPQWGVNIGSTVTTTGTGNGNSNMQAVLAVKNNDFGIAYGAGLDFGATVRMDLGFRGFMGLMDISDQSKTLETNSYFILQKKGTQTYQAYLGLTFLF